MYKVTSVEQQKSNPRRFNIFLDGKFAFGADEDLVVNYRLVLGKLIETQDLEKLLFEAQVGKLMERMYTLFSIRQRSEKEVRDRFKYKTKEEISEIVIESLIQNLKQKNLIDDEQFAKSWVESRRVSKQKGKIAIKSELAQKGISGEIIEKVMGGSAIGEDEIAMHALEKKMKSWKRVEPQKLKQKIFNFLGRKGFEYNVILTVISRLLKDKNRVV